MIKTNNYKHKVYLSQSVSKINIDRSKFYMSQKNYLEEERLLKVTGGHKCFLNQPFLDTSFIQNLSLSNFPRFQHHEDAYDWMYGKASFL